MNLLRKKFVPARPHICRRSKLKAALKLFRATFIPSAWCSMNCSPAGGTPSPEMVAAAPTEGALKPVVALSLFAAFVVLLIVSSWATKYGFLYRLAPLNQSPEVLRARARDIITRVGYTDPVFDSADGMIVHREYLN